ncbi:MAG: hypothetical protein MUF50_04505, partial [Planctomycetes bacterium]|nr:hypothetical protein [Planctomycetota bacterium]
MNNFPGKFIVLYGINNLGKSTQAKKLVERLNSYGQKTEYLKYPIYDLHPSGKVLNNYLRGGNIFELTAREAQLIYTLNRTQYQNELIKKLQNGINIIAEDYTGTGLAWGIGAGVDEHFLKGINSHLLKEDLAFLFDGERFLSGLENGHKHETNNELTEKVRKIHWRLAEELSWVKINANLSIDEIHKVLWKYITTIIHNDNFKEKLINREKLEKLTAERITDTAKLPSKSYNHDAGFDLYANEYYSLLPGQRTAI